MKKIFGQICVSSLLAFVVIFAGCKGTGSDNSASEKEDIAESAADSIVEEAEVYVDLGLPSGRLWAKCNIGAKNPEDSGDFFAWGETTVKNEYIETNNKYYYVGSDENGFDALSVSKYNAVAYYGSVDNKMTLDPEDDAATANLGEDWRMPTKEDMEELVAECTWTSTTINGVEGFLVAGPNGNSIFLPFAGRIYLDEISVADKGYYFTNSIDADDSNAYALVFNSDNKPCVWSTYRYYGCPVRPVRK